MECHKLSTTKVRYNIHAERQPLSKLFFSISEQVSVYHKRRAPGYSRRDLLPLGVDRMPGRHDTSFFSFYTDEVHTFRIHGALLTYHSKFLLFVKFLIPNHMPPKSFGEPGCGYKVASARLNPQLPLFRLLLGHITESFIKPVPIHSQYYFVIPHTERQRVLQPSHAYQYLDHPQSHSPQFSNTYLTCIKISTSNFLHSAALFLKILHRPFPGEMAPEERARKRPSKLLSKSSLKHG